MSTHGFSERGLARLHRVMTGYVDRGELVGGVTLLARRGEALVDAFGTRAQGGDAMTRDTIFRIASMTKPVIAVATMILVEECRLRLDDSVVPLLPELAERRVLKHVDGDLAETVASSRDITVRDLLTFRMGLGMVLGPSTPIQKEMEALSLGQGPPGSVEVPPPDEWMRRLGTLPLMYAPGGHFLYNTGADVLGVLIARAAGQPLEDFLRERIFTPLGMHDTAFSVPSAQLHRLADAYWPDPQTGALTLYDSAASGYWSRPPAFPSGAGGLVSTVDDYLAFGRMLLGKGRLGDVRVLSRPSVETMVTDQLTPDQKSRSPFFPGFWESRGWGFGLAVVTRRIDLSSAPGRFGWDGGLGTSAYMDPAEDLVAILMTQRALTSWSIVNDFWTCVYQAIDD